MLIAVPSFSLCFYLLAVESHGVLAYVSYGLAAYSLAIIVTGFAKIVKAVRGGIKNHPLTQRALSVKPVGRFAEDLGFRAMVSLYFGSFMNLMYIVLKLFSGIYYKSAWFIALAVYYSLLAAIRFSLAKYLRKNGEVSNISAELGRYRLCGIMLLVMNAALGVMVAFIVHQNKGFEYAGMLIYAMAAYTFYITVTAIINTVKFRKKGSPVLSAAKAVNLAASLVSMVSLTTAMLNTFGNDADFRQLMTALTGGGACVLILAMAVYMIASSTKKLRDNERSMRNVG